MRRPSPIAFSACFLWLLILFPSCARSAQDDSWSSDEGGAPSAPDAARPGRQAVAAGNAALPDKGIWPDLDSRAGLHLPSRLSADNVSIVVDKTHRVLTVLSEKTPVISYPVALGPAPEGDKRKRGDGRTPEGAYYICEMSDKGLEARYGARSLRLSYPDKKDAAAGFAAGLIGAKEKQAIEEAVARRKVPPQNTGLGGSIRIHGGGAGRDWTLGCVALRDADIIDLYRVVKIGTPVTVLSADAARPYSDLDGDGIPDQVDVLLGAKKTVANGDAYDGRYVQIPPKGGDVPRGIGVCTDVIVRALRNAGCDLQVEIQKDRASRPSAYPAMKDPNPSIDHRRVKNMVPWFAAHWKTLPTDDAKTFLPGDVIFMDTLPNPGPDHVGIISDRASTRGWPLVINNWTVGYRTSEMELLPDIPVLGHYRWE